MNRKYADFNWNEIYKDIIFCGIIMVFAFFINRGISIKGLYMDDLYMWSCYGEQSFFEYVFPMGSTRFRFIYYLIAYIVLGVTGTHVTWLVPINIILNGSIAILLYFIAKKLSNYRWIGLVCGIMYSLSRMSYYQIGQLYGLMESFALLCAIGIFYLCFKYVNDDKRGDRSFITANILYFIICFIHERYMVLLPMLLIVLFLRKPEKKSMFVIPIINFGVIQLIRIMTIGTLSPAGTGGTDVAATFSISQALYHALEQVAYIFGINAGPEHLNGMPFSASPQYIKTLVIASAIMLLVLIVSFAARVISAAEKTMYIKNCVLFIGFIACLIASSSVTIRVEVRWVYVSYTMALLFMAYMYGVLSENRKNLYTVFIVIYVIFMFPAECFYRGQYKNIYLFPNQKRYNSLAEETYEKYGRDIFGKTIYIIGNSYEMSDFTAETFFKVYDPARKAEGTKVVHIDDIYDIGLVTDDMLIIREEPEQNKFQDVTEFTRGLKCEAVYGYYKDGWMDENAELNIMAGQKGEIVISFTYPGELKGGETVSLIIDDEDNTRIEMKENTESTIISAEPGKRVNIKFSNNFIMQDAREQRGADKLSVIAKITAE